MNQETTKKKPDRKNLGPTGPMETPPDSREHATYEEKHLNPGSDGKDIPVVPPAGPHEDKHRREDTDRKE